MIALDSPMGFCHCMRMLLLPGWSRMSILVCPNNVNPHGNEYRRVLTVLRKLKLGLVNPSYLLQEH